MPRSTHGEYDQVVEIGASFFRDQAAGTFNLPAQDIASAPGEGFTYTGRVRATLRDLWLGDAAETFNPTTSKWQTAQRVAPWNAVAFGIDISGSIEVASIQVTTQSGQTLNLPVPSSVRTLRVHVGVLILAPLSVENLATRSARDEKFSSTRFPCAVVILPTATFFYNVQVGMGDRARPYAQQPHESVRGSPFVNWAIETINTLRQAGVPDLPDPEVGVVAKIEQVLRDTVKSQIRAALDSACDWGLKAQRRLGLVKTTPEMGVTRMDVKTTFDSIRVFMQTTGTGGQAQLATRSQLRAGLGDDMAITVNGRALLEQLRAPLIQKLGVQSSDFVAGEPCTIASPVTVTLGGSSVTLLYLQAGVDESSNLILWLFLRSSLPLGGSVEVEVELPIAFEARRALRGTQQVILLSLRPGQARIAARADTVPVVHWIVEAETRRKVNDGLVAITLDPQVLPAPQTLLVEVNDLNLNQAGAPRYDRTWPGMRLIGGDFQVGVISDPGGVRPGRFREHDLVLRLSAVRPYPSPLTVSCVTPDSKDPMARIDGLGGNLPVPAGTAGPPVPWAMAIDDAIDWVHGGKGMKLSDGTAVILGRAPSDCPPTDPTNGSTPYLRTSADTATSNNLGELPACPTGVRS